MIFVTGGTGLVGSHLLLSLVRQNDRVRALKRKVSRTDGVKKVFGYYVPDPERFFSRIEWVEGDIHDIYSLDKGFQGVELIYHCAAVVSFESRERKRILYNNIEGTANVVNAAISCGVKRICHVSSNAALGTTIDGMAVTEETGWVPSRKNSGYSESKFFSEAEVWRGVEEGLEAVVVNPSFIIGPGDWDRGSTTFFRLIDRGLKFYTRGITGFVDVRDVVDTMLLLTDSKNFEIAVNQKFLISAENVAYRDIFRQIATALGKPAPPYFASGFLLAIAWRAAALWSWIIGKAALITREALTNSNAEVFFDGSKITRLFGFRYRSIPDAIAHTAACYIKDKTGDS